MTDGSDAGAPGRISGLQRSFEGRVFNPFLRWLLRSRLHWVASRWILLVSYEGRRSGRRYTFPVAYARRDGSLVVVTPRSESQWWKNFRRPRPCTVRYRGVDRDATGEVVTGDERTPLLRRYFQTHGAMGRLLGVSAADPEAETFEGIAVVRFDLSGERS